MDYVCLDASGRIIVYSHLKYNSKIESADKIGKALDFSGNKEAQKEKDGLIKKFMRENGLNSEDELVAF